MLIMLTQYKHMDSTMLLIHWLVSQLVSDIINALTRSKEQREHIIRNNYHM